MNKSNVIRRFTVVIFVAIGMAGCSKVNIEDNKDETVEVIFTGEIANQIETRLQNGAWSRNDSIGIYMVKNGTLEIKDGAENHRYITYWGDGRFVSHPAPWGVSTPIIYPDDASENVDFIAYFPQRFNVNNYTIEFNITTQERWFENAQCDLLYASTYTTKPEGYNKYTPDNVYFSFDHRFAKFIIKTIPGNGDINMDDLKVSIQGMNTQAKFNILKNEIEVVATSSGTIQPCIQTSGKEYYAIVLPGVNTGNDWVIHFKTKDGKEHKWRVPANMEIKSGYQYIWTLTLQTTQVELATSDIQPWVTGGDDSGIAWPI